MTMVKDVLYIDYKLYHTINLVGKIERKSQHTKLVNTKFGETKVCDAYLADESGSIKLTLWADDIERVKDGYTIKIKDGYVNAWRSLTTKRSSPLRIISIDPNYNEKPKKLFKQSTNLPSEDMGITIDEQDEDVEYATMAEIAKIERQFWRESLA